MSKIDQKSKFNAKVAMPKASDIILSTYSKLTGAEGSYISNYYQWYEWWRDARIGRYGAEFRDQFETGSSPSFSLTAKLEDYPLGEELQFTKDYWLPTIEQYNELSAMENISNREYQEKTLFTTWSSAQRLRNVQIKEANEINKIKRAGFIKLETTYKDTVSQIFADILGSMDKLSQQKVLDYQEEREEDLYTSDTARIAGDWYFLFVAAKAVHIVRNSASDGISVELRQDQEEKLLLEHKHKAGPYYKWLQGWRNQLTTCESVDLVLSPTKRKMIFMKCIHQTMFAPMLQMWSSFVTRQQFPDEIEELISLVTNQYDELAISNPALVIRSERKPHEASFVTTKADSRGSSNEKAGSANTRGKGKGYSKCPVCMGKPHDPLRCPQYNPDFSLEENISYQNRIRYRAKKGKPAKQDAKEETNVTFEKEDEGDADPPEDAAAHGRRGGKRHHKVNLVMFETTDRHFPGTEEDSVTPLTCYKLDEEITFTLDTATESGTVDSNAREILTDIVKDTVTLSGIGGTVRLNEMGHYLFGSARVLLDSKGRNLISYPQASRDFQIENPDPSTLILKGWKGTIYEPVEWVFKQDLATYGDTLYHCSIGRKEYISTYSNVKQAQTLKSYLNMYDNQPNTGTDDTIKIVDNIHKLNNHATADQLARIIECDSSDHYGITKVDIDLWRETIGNNCPGCIRGKMKEHPHHLTTNPAKLRMSSLGDGAGDLMFVDQPTGARKPAYVHLDRGSKYLMVSEVKGKDINNMEKCLTKVIDTFKYLKHPLNSLTFDRESSIVPLTDWLLGKGVKVYLKAAKQKVGDIEASIRYIREAARATKAGVQDDYGYKPPAHWNFDLLQDVVGIRNLTPREGQLTTPFEAIHGFAPDLLRCMRGRWGETVIAKKPRGIASDLRESGSWGVIVRRTFDGSGIVKLYMVESKRYAWRLNFRRGMKTPNWVTVAIGNVAPESIIGFEDGESTPELAGLKASGSAEPLTDPNSDEITETDVPSTIAKFYDRLDEEDGNTNIRHEINEDELLPVQEYIHDSDFNEQIPIPYEGEYIEDINDNKRRSADSSLAREIAHIPPAASKRQSKPVERLVFTTKVKYVNLFDAALRERPESAAGALKKELDIIQKKDVWKGVLWEDLTPEQHHLILNNTKNYIEKFYADGSFEKSKVRVLTRGDKQFEVGPTDGPVCRVESIHLICIIALLRGLKVIKIDFTGAYLNTPMPNDVKHRWLLLDKHVSAELVRRDAAYWKPFLRKDGRILVEMLKLIYGYREAAHYWNQILLAMFVSDGYTVHPNDPCVVFKREGDNEVYIAITVDDCTTAISRDGPWENKLHTLCQKTFGEFTVDDSDNMSIIGMLYEFNYKEKSVKVSQRKFINKLLSNREIISKSKYPCGTDIFESDPTSPLIKNQLDYMSGVMSCMYGATRTYPEILPVVGILASKNGKASEQDFLRMNRVCEYLNFDHDHALYFRPKSLKVIASADASYAEHEDAKSHTGGCVGVEGVDGPVYFLFLSTKQTIVAKSSAESELIAASTLGDSVVWVTAMINGFGLGTGVPATLEQDNQSAISFLQQGRGNYKRTKHINVRYFWLKQLIDLNQLLVKYVPTLEMVSDLLSKPLLGSKFMYLRDKLLGQPTAVLSK